MPVDKLTLWLLNRCVLWDVERLAAALSPRYDVRVGRRRVADAGPAPNGSPELFVNERGDGFRGELMNERDAAGGPSAYDEYFVPIPVKCVGDPRSRFWRETADPGDGARRLHGIEAALAARFGGALRHDPTSAKDTIGPHFGDVTMNLVDKTLGYYELLRRAADQTGGKNVLVGYSQGGTVARYLAFLDERVAAPGRRCIHGIVTVQSPNRGSPVASKAKSADVATAIVAILLSLPRWLPEAQLEASPVWRFLRSSLAHDALIRFVNGLLDAEMETWAADPAKRALRLWRTTRKWLSGLSGVPDLAFWDLDPLRVAEPDSVLQAIDAYPLGAVRQGAVVGCDGRLDDFVEALLAEEGCLLGLVGKLERKAIARLVRQAGAIYADHVMSFPRGSGAVGSSYWEGLAAGTHGLDAAIEPKAHDFVIPAVSQVLVAAQGGANHLGNRVNADASHLTGADLTGRDGGRSDEDLVVEMLGKM